MLITFANIFQPLIDVFETVLKFFHNSVGVPWGWSIVLLTICVRALLVPLTIKQMGSMARMQRLQPQMKEIQNKYKEDKQRQQQEMMKFYRENNVNPLGSCLPLVAQLPVFISLYYMLRQSLRDDICHGVQVAYRARYALKHPHTSASTLHGLTTACSVHGASHGANFLFITDLTSKASGLTLIALIVLYVGSQLGSSLMMSNATMDPTQRRVMMFMPLIFVLFVIRFPAGLLVYWITTNLWTLGQQYLVKRRIGPATAAVVETNGADGNGTTTSLPVGSARAGSSGSVRAGSSRSGGEGGALGAIMRRVRPAQPTVSGRATGSSSSGGPPPRPPRKKKKRSGRRR
jgi:YidC/Oxa1 family membrane protein insertase